MHSLGLNAEMGLSLLQGVLTLDVCATPQGQTPVVVLCQVGISGFKGWA